MFAKTTFPTIPASIPGHHPRASSCQSSSESFHWGHMEVGFEKRTGHPHCKSHPAGLGAAGAATQQEWQGISAALSTPIRSQTQFLGTPWAMRKASAQKGKAETLSIWVAGQAASLFSTQRAVTERTCEGPGAWLPRTHFCPKDPAQCRHVHGRGRCPATGPHLFAQKAPLRG